MTPVQLLSLRLIVRKLPTQCIHLTLKCLCAEQVVLFYFVRTYALFAQAHA
jgi:hypothetical protein